MESGTGNLQAAQNVYQRAIRDTLVTDNLNEKTDYIVSSLNCLTIFTYQFIIVSKLCLFR